MAPLARGFPLRQQHCGCDRGGAGQHSASRPYVRSAAEQSIERGNIIAASCPVERRLLNRRARWLQKTRIYICASPDQQGYCLLAIREVARPVGRDVQECARYSLSVNDPRHLQTWIVVQ